MLQSACSPEGVSDAPRVVVGRPWQPGAPSPNPSGRPRKTPAERDAEALAKKNSPQAMRRLVKMFEDKDTSEAGRLRAIELVLAYGLGKPSSRDDVDAASCLTVQIVSYASAPEMLRPIRGVINSPVKENVWRVEGEQGTRIDDRPGVNVLTGPSQAGWRQLEHEIEDLPKCGA